MTDSSTNTPPNPAPIFQLATGYWASATLLAANRIGLFAALAKGEKSAAAITADLRTDPRATAMLLDACVGLGLLLKQGENYSLSPTAAAFLVPGRPGYLGSALEWSRDQYAAWGSLAQSVAQGKPAVDPRQHLGSDPAQTRAFVHGMHQRAQGVARGVVPFIDLAGCGTLLDVGGGPGTYATLLAQKYPTLQVTVVDLEGIVAVARELIAATPGAERVQLQAGDATAGDYGSELYHAVLFSGVLHQMDPTTIRRMLQGAQRALKPGGVVYISDMMLDDSKTQPLFSALFSLQMLLTTASGAVFAASESEAWLREVGFGEIVRKPLPPPLPYTIVSARK